MILYRLVVMVPITKLLRIPATITVTRTFQVSLVGSGSTAPAQAPPRRGAATLSPLPIGAAVVRVHGQALQGAIAHVLPDKIAGALDVIDPIFAATIALSLFFHIFHLLCFFTPFRRIANIFSLYPINYL